MSEAKLSIFRLLLHRLALTPILSTSEAKSLLLPTFAASSNCDTLSYRRYLSVGFFEFDLVLGIGQNFMVDHRFWEADWSSTKSWLE